MFWDLVVSQLKIDLVVSFHGCARRWSVSTCTSILTRTQNLFGTNHFLVSLFSYLIIWSYYLMIILSFIFHYLYHWFFFLIAWLKFPKTSNSSNHEHSLVALIFEEVPFYIFVCLFKTVVAHVFRSTFFTVFRNSLVHYNIIFVWLNLFS